MLTSWLETSNTQNCSFRSTMSIQRLRLARSTPDTPHTLSFGLWGQCAIYDSHCSCTPTSLSYTPDNRLVATTAGQIAKIVLVFLSNISLFLAVISYHLPILHPSVCLSLTLLALVWIASGFGVSYNHYHQQIKNACQSQIWPCADADPGLETILFGLVIGLLVVVTTILLLFLIQKSPTQPQETDHISLQSATFTNAPTIIDHNYNYNYNCTPTHPYTQSFPQNPDNINTNLNNYDYLQQKPIEDLLPRGYTFIKSIPLHPPPNHCSHNYYNHHKISPAEDDTRLNNSEHSADTDTDTDTGTGTGTRTRTETRTRTRTRTKYRTGAGICTGTGTGTNTCDRAGDHDHVGNGTTSSGSGSGGPGGSGGNGGAGTTISTQNSMCLIPAHVPTCFSRWSRPLAKRESQCSHHTFGSDVAWTHVVPRLSAETVMTLPKSIYPYQTGTSSQFCMTPGCGNQTLDPDYFPSLSQSHSVSSSHPSLALELTHSSIVYYEDDDDDEEDDDDI
ncbi:hypothetical protein F4703DRAFT_1971685 [Phycomyces blakesleeanus]